MQLNIAGTHFGTYEYEFRPQKARWRRGVWHINFESICQHRNIIFLEEWTPPDFRQAKNFVGYANLSKENRKASYMKWASTSSAEIKKKWERCYSVDDSLDCEIDMANEMRAHNTADKLSISKEKIWQLLSPYSSCIEAHFSCR